MATQEELIQKLKDTIVSIIKEHLGEFQDDFKETIDGCVKEIAKDTARYAVAAAKGEPEAKTNMDHLLRQSYALAAITLQHGRNEGAKTIVHVISALAKFAGIFLKGLIT